MSEAPRNIFPYPHSRCLPTDEDNYTQTSLDQGTLPSIWKTAKVVPIYKKGNKSDPCNYRPVSLMCRYLLQNIRAYGIFKCV